MRVVPLQPDAPQPALPAPAGGAFSRAVSAAADALQQADAAENAYAARAGSLQDAVLERARADVALSIATAAAGRATQAIQSILNLQI